MDMKYDLGISGLMRGKSLNTRPACLRHWLQLRCEAHWWGTEGGLEGKEAINTGDSLKGHIRATGYREGQTFN